MNDEPICSFLEWDSSFFGHRIAQIKPRRLDRNAITKAIAWCEGNQIDCLYLLVASNDAKTTRLAEIYDCNFVDIRMTYSLAISDSLVGGMIAKQNKVTIRSSCLDDLPSLEAIARVSYTDSRFYYDPHFSDVRCSDFYATWLQESCQGYADMVLVAELKERPVGYITCHNEGEEGKIGLVGVAPGAQAKGIGSDLLEASLKWFADENTTQVSVVTQGRNVGAQRFYQRAGFTTKVVELWFHRWFKDVSGI